LPALSVQVVLADWFAAELDFVIVSGVRLATPESASVHPKSTVTSWFVHVPGVYVVSSAFLMLATDTFGAVLSTLTLIVLLVALLPALSLTLSETS
jgi:hypothetical protein